MESFGLYKDRNHFPSINKSITKATFPKAKDQLRFFLENLNQKRSENFIQKAQKLFRIKDFVIVQHAGANNENPDHWRKHMDNLLTGAEVDEVKRTGYFFLPAKNLKN